MDCNRDEAKTAMEISEKKVTEADYKGAKNFANKAQKMFPELDGLKQLLVTIEVYMSGEKKICGESDWYGILGVDPLAADEEVRKQYKKLALMLHPDKNKFKGAEGAFKLLSEAWGVLSDSDKRKSYNKKRKIKETQRTVPATQTANPSQQPTPSYRSEPVTVESRPKPKPRGRKGKSSMGSPPFVSSVQKEWFVKRRNLKTSQRGVGTTQNDNPPHQPACYRPKPCGRMRMVSPPSVSSMQKERATFWTQCDKCKMHYEHKRVYVKKFLICPTCQCSFFAEEKPPPSHISEAANVSSNQQNQSSKNQAAKKKSSDTSGREHAPSANSQNATQEAVNVVPQAQDSVQRGFEVGESQGRDAARGFTDYDLRNFKRLKTDDSQSGPFSGECSNQTGATTSATSSDPAKGDAETLDTIAPK